jgi:hypothetical protein
LHSSSRISTDPGFIWIAYHHAAPCSLQDNVPQLAASLIDQLVIQGLSNIRPQPQFRHASHQQFERAEDTQLPSAARRRQFHHIAPP